LPGLATSYPNDKNTAGSFRIVVLSVCAIAAPSSPSRTPAKHPSAVATPSPWGSPSRSYNADRWQQLDEAAHQAHSAWLLDSSSHAMQAEQQLHPYCAEGGLQDDGDRQHVLEESIILLEHRAQLQVQVRTLVILLQA
jgi:hypothetical protein